ncbi:synaptic plasticity regulator PANTS [Haematobia irritans]|uniref:synaptic plasticity regulator PANTS n=1 Tax=Haematobia irritans TaxID=7368 RepID=UPI003F5085EC
MTEKDKNSNELNTAVTLKDAWAIRPCSVYKDEYDDCTSFKARFHQYFIHGENTDCTQWQTDYKNCVRYQDSNGNDVQAGEAVVRSEEERRLRRFRGHYGNTVWEKRKSPPEDWSKPLPEWLEKKNENSYLQLKQMEMDGRAIPEDSKSYCMIM